MRYIPQLQHIELLQHQFRRFALYTPAAIRLLLKRWSSPAVYKEIEEQFQILLDGRVSDTERTLKSVEIDWVFMLEPLMVDGKAVLLLRSARVTEGWTPTFEEATPAAYASVTFTVTLEVDLETNQIVGVSETAEPSVNYLFGITTELQHLFPPPEQPAAEAPQEGAPSDG